MDSLGVLVIAGILFLVTMALAVGPLLLCRLFAGSSEACLPRKRRHPFATGNVAACGSMAAVAGALFAMWFVTGETRQTVILGEDQPATAVGATEIAATPIGSERSLFDGNQSSSDPAPTVHVVSHRLSWAAILLPLLLATTLLGVVSDRLRGGLFRVLPVVFAGGLLIVLFVRSSTHHEYHRAVVAHSVQLAHHDTEQMLAAEMTENPDHTLAASPPVVAPKARAATEPPSTVGTADTAVAPADADQVPNIMEYVGTTADGMTCDALPDWTDRVEVLGPMRVIRSGPHATVELAEQQALAELKSVLLAEFVRQHPEARAWQPPDELVLHSGSILRRAVERSQITVGEFSNPMYEAYWQVDPTIGTAPLTSAWRPTVVHQRLAWLGGGIGLLTLLLGSLAAGLRVDEQTGGKRRKALTLGTLALWAVVGGAALLVA